MMKDICKVLNADLESVLNGDYDSFGNIDYDGNLYWVRVCMNSSLPVYVPINNTNKNWEITYALYFGRDENCSTKIAEFRFFDGEPKKHIVNQMSQIILHWISKTRIKKPKEKKCEFKYLDEDEARINKASENLGMKFESHDDFEHERARFLKDIDERDQSISDLIDANEKLTKENDKLSVDISREKDKHDAATEKCKELTKDAEFWKEKAYEMDKKNCELRSRNRELEKEVEKINRKIVDKLSRKVIDLEEKNRELKKELDEEKCKLICQVEITPETCQAIDVLQKKVEKLESDNESYELENNDLVCSLAHKTRQIEKLEKERDYYKDRAVKYDEIFSELNNAMEAAGYKLRRIPDINGKIYQREKLTREDLF